MNQPKNKLGRFGLSQSLKWHSLEQSDKNLILFVGICLFIFIAFRIWRLSFPGTTVFDEVYFPKMAWQYLQGEQFFDIHPPLGKLIIALGELIFHNTPFGWRLLPLLFGIGLIPAASWASYQLFRNWRLSLIASFLIAIDGMMIVYSRTGLMDGFILFFGLLSLGYCWKFRLSRSSGRSAWLPMMLSGIFAGLAVAIKWIGLGFLPIVAITALLVLVTTKKPRADIWDYLIWLLSFVVYPAILYTVPFLANWQQNFWSEFLNWHKQSWEYNVHLQATHPYASKWWSWPFLIRPIWFYYKNEASQVIGVDAIGNPVLWWLSSLAVVYTLVTCLYSLLIWRRPKQQILSRTEFWALLFLLAGWAAFYLPWVKVGRVLFLYHYLTSYLFALLLSSYWLSRIWQDRSHRLVVALLLLCLAISFIFLPIWIAYPISQQWFDHGLMWFKSWI